MYMFFCDRPVCYTILTISKYTKFKILIYFEADHFTTIEQN